MSDPDNTATTATVQPRRWWQWFLLYPALAISVITSLPTVFDKAGAFVTNVMRPEGLPEIRSLEDAEHQKAMWQRNATCDTTLRSWVQTEIGIKLDATICPATGDILIQAMTREHRPFFRWLSARDQVVDEQESLKTASLSFGLSSPAHAAAIEERTIGRTGSYSKQNLYHRTQFGQLICSRQIGPRTILRRFGSPQGCFDQIVDMYTGQVLQQNPAPCGPC